MQRRQLEMVSYSVCLRNSDNVKNLVSIVDKLNYDADLLDGSVVVDAKSLIGVMTMDLSEKLELRLHTDNEDEALKEQLKDILV